MFCVALNILAQYPFSQHTPSGSHFDLNHAPYCYVLCGVKYIGLVPLVLVADFDAPYPDLSSHAELNVVGLEMVALRPGSKSMLIFARICVCACMCVYYIYSIIFYYLYVR